MDAWRVLVKMPADLRLEQFLLLFVLWNHQSTLWRNTRSIRIRLRGAHILLNVFWLMVKLCGWYETYLVSESGNEKQISAKSLLLYSRWYCSWNLGQRFAIPWWEGKPRFCKARKPPAFSNFYFRLFPVKVLARRKLHLRSPYMRCLLVVLALFVSVSSLYVVYPPLFCF